MRDGIHLATDIYLPVTKTPLPTIFARTPYDKSHEELGYAQVAAFLNARGYAFVAQDIRGKARSEGQVEAFVHDVSDGYDSLTWLVTQSWCNGSIAMWGESYNGFTEWAAAASGHPALKAIVPLDTTSDIESWFYRQRVFELQFAGPGRVDIH